MNILLHRNSNFMLPCGEGNSEKNRDAFGLDINLSMGFAGEIKTGFCLS